jgi:hypothetical protein
MQENSLEVGFIVAEIGQPLIAKNGILSAEPTLDRKELQQA